MRSDCFKYILLLLSCLALHSCHKADVLPVAVHTTAVNDDYFKGLMNEPLLIDFLKNDHIAEKSWVKITLPPAHGILKYDNQLKVYHYLPAANFVGADSLHYQVSTSLQTYQAKIVIIIQALPCSHVATADYFIVKSGELTRLPVLLNDFLCGQLAGVSVEQSSLKCETVIQNGRELWYKAKITSGQDTLNYALHSKNGIESVAQVIIKVIH